MLTFLLNPVLTHLAAAGLGAGLAWWATHRTIASALEQSAAHQISSTVAAIKADLGTLKKDV
jgi:hypothetical protein